MPLEKCKIYSNKVQLLNCGTLTFCIFVLNEPMNINAYLTYCLTSNTECPLRTNNGRNCRINTMIPRWAYNTWRHSCNIGICACSTADWWAWCSGAIWSFFTWYTISAIGIFSCLKFTKQYVMLWVIWYHFYNLKNVKNTHGRMLLFSLLKVALLHECFSRFLNCKNDTKSRNTSNISKNIKA